MTKKKVVGQAPSVPPSVQDIDNLFASVKEKKKQQQEEVKEAKKANKKSKRTAKSEDDEEEEEEEEEEEQGKRRKKASDSAGGSSSSLPYGVIKSNIVQIINPEAPVERIDPETGYKVYKAHLLRVGDGGGTPLCPFDCDCCF
jgi:hypothetical protein